MNQLRNNLLRPWGLAGISIVVLLLAIGLVGVVGVIENERVKDAAERALASMSQLRTPATTCG